MIKQFIAGLQQHDARPIIRKVARLLASLFLLVIAILLYAPALGDTRFVFGTDTVSHDYIMHYYGWAKSIGKAGELPLWNPYLFSGFPMIASAALCPFYPTQWLYLILPFNTAFTMQYVLALAVGGIGAAWWMRCLGHRRSICVWAGLAYMVSGHFLTLTYAGHLQKMMALGWTPVAFGATMQLVRYGRMGRRSTHLYKTAAILGIALGMQLLASHPQIFYATAAACILQLIGMTLTALPWKTIIPSARPAEAAPAGKIVLPVGEALAMSALAIVVCVLISAVQLFPTLEMSAISNRADGVSFVEAVETSYPPLEIFEYAVPQIFGDSVRNSPMPYFGKWGERIVSDYVGLPILFLALTGLFGSRRRYRWFLLILFVVGIVVGLGRYTPVYWLLYHVLPGFDGFRSPGTFMFLSNCALIGLSAFGLDYLVNLANTVNDQGWGSSFSGPEEEHVTPTKSAFASTTANDTQPFAVDAIHDPDAHDTPPYMPSLEHEAAPIEDPGYVYSYGQAAGASSSNFTWDNENTPWLGRPAMLVFLAAVAVTALVGAVIALAKNWEVDLKIATDAERMNYHTYSRMAGAAIAVMTLLMAILLLRLRTWIGGVAIGLVALAFPLYHNFHFLQFEPLTPYMAHITKQADLLKLGKEASQPVRLVEENQLKNEGMLHNVASASGYHPIILSSYSDAMATLGPASDAFGDIFAINYGRTFSEEPPADGTWQPYSGGTTPGRGSSLWQRTNLAPYVRSTAEVTKVDTDEMSLTSSSLRAIAMDAMAGGAGARTEKSVAYVARISEYDSRRFRLYEGMQMAEAKLQRWSPHEIRLHTEAAAPGARQNALLPLSEPFSPGWHAETSGGRRLPIIAVNGLQRGVVVPPGEFNIRLRYIPYALRLGLFVSLISATVLLAFGMGTIGRRIMRGQKKVQKAFKHSQADKPATTTDV